MLAGRNNRCPAVRDAILNLDRAAFRFALPGLVLAALAADPATAQESSLPAPLAVPQQAESTNVDDWTVDVFRLPGTNEALCVATKSFPSGDRFGFIIGDKGRGLLYGRPGLKVKEGTTMDFGFSVDERPPLRLPGGAYDPETIMSAPLPSPEGEKLYEIFTRGGKAVIGSNDLKFRSEALDLKGSGQVIKAIDHCAEVNGIHVVTREDTPAPAKPAAGAPVAGSTFDAGPDSAPPPPPSAVAPPAPAESTPAAEAAAPAATQKAVQDLIAAEAKKRNAGVGYATVMPKDVTGDKLEDIVVLFVLVEKDLPKGYVGVLKATGKDGFIALNTVPLGGVPSQDPPIFTQNGMDVTLKPGADGKARDVIIVITAKSLTVQKK